MKAFGRTISIVLLLSLLVSLVPNTALALSNSNGDKLEFNTSVAPEGYVLKNTFLDRPLKILSEDNVFANKKVLLIEDNDPWDTDTNQLVLSEITSYDKVSTSEFLSVDLSQYAVVVFANDQGFSTYENYREFKEYLELFASIGGVIVFGACDSGWANGSLIEDLPGGVSKTNHYEYRNYIDDYRHPIVTAELSDYLGLLNEDLYNNYCSHISFDENSLPPGTKIILRETTTDRPTLIEYPLGKGRVIASGLTWEHNYAYGINNGYGAFAQKAMNDMFQYAIYVSNINVEDIEVLENYYLNIEAHKIFVGDKTNLEPIKNAEIVIRKGNSIINEITDENGLANILDLSGVSEIEIAAPGYENYKFIYDIQPRAVRYFHLDKMLNENQPYITMALAEEREKYTDLKMQQLYFEKDSQEISKIILEGQWPKGKHGKYIIYQQEKSVESRTGIFNIKPGDIFKPGQKIYAMMVTDDGTRSKPLELGLLIKNKKISFGPDNDKGFRLGDKMGFSVDPDLPIIGGTSLDIELDFIPISFVYDEKKVKLGIGITDSAKFEKNWDKFVENIEKTKENIKSFKDLTRYMEAFGWKSGAFTIKDDWSPKLNVYGYGEGILDDDGNITNIKGYILMEAGGNYKYQQQFAVGPVPVYFEIGGGLNLKTELGLSKILREEGSMSLIGKLTITPEFDIGGGAGIVGAVTVGAAGKVELPVLFDFPEQYQQVKLVGSMSLKASALFVFNAKKEILRGEWVIYETHRNNRQLDAQGIMGDQIMGDQFDIADLEMYEKESRDYLYKTTGWNSGNQDLALMSLGFDNDRQFETLQKWVLPNTMPQVAELKDGRLIMVFQSDNEDRDDNNRTTLMYSIYDKGSWSQPEAVWDNGAPDFYSRLEKHGDDLYLVWQKASRALDSQDGLDISEQMINMASLSEIAYGKWDYATDSFSDIAYITNDDTLDMLPSLAVVNEEVQLVWLNNNDNKLMGDGGLNTVNIAIQKGDSWDIQTGLISSSNPIVNLESHSYNDKLYISYIMDLDNDLNTNDDKEIFIYTDNQIIQLTNNDLADLAPQFKDNKLYWYSNGNIQTYDLNNRTLNQVFDEETSINSSYRLIEGSDGKMALAWIVNKDVNQSAIKASLDMGNRWSNEFELASRNDIIQSTDILLDRSGNWNLVANTVDLETTDEPSSLIFGLLKPQTDTRLNAVYAEDSNRINNIQPIELDMTNLGETEIELLEIEVLDSFDGTSVYRTEIPYYIGVGEEAIIKLDLPLPKIDRESQYTIKARAIDEINLQDNTGVITLGYTDVSIDITQYNQGDRILVVAQIENKTDIPTEVAISVIEDSIDGITLDMKNLGTIDSERDIIYTYSIDKNKIKFKDNDFKAYYFNVQTSEKDIVEANNTSILIVDKEEILAYEGEPGDPVEIIPVIGIEFDHPDDVELVYGVNMDEDNSTLKLNVLFNPENASYQDIRWESSNEAVASVDENGLVVARGIGLTTIRAITYDGEHSSSINVTVADDLEDNYLLWDDESSTELDKVWKVEFNSKINEDIFSKDNFIYVRDSNNRIHETVLTILDDEATVAVEAKRPYRYGEKYTLYVSRQLENREGKSLPKTVKMNFEILEQ